MVPTFLALDPDTHQPVCFTTATSARTATLKQPYQMAKREAGRLWNEHIDPQVPWLYGFKLDFRFR